MKTLIDALSHAVVLLVLVAALLWLAEQIVSMLGRLT
jgi:hypothetical protein